MADIKISALPVATSVNTSDIAVLNQGGITKTANLALIRGTSQVTSFSAGTTGFTPSVATSGIIALEGTLNVTNGGTGVTTSVGTNSVVLRDSNANIAANAFIGTLSTIPASTNQITLLRSSSVDNLITGSGGQTIKLPDATTLTPGSAFSFNNNQSSGAVLVNNNSNTLVASVPSGGFSNVSLLDNATVAGTWERHEQAPSNVSWSTNTLDYPGSITSATWNGNAVAVNRGGTGATTQQAALNAISGTQTAGYHFRSDGANVSLQPMNVSDVTAGTLAIANGGTGQTTTENATRALGGVQVAQIRNTATLVLATAGTITGGSWTSGLATLTFTSSSVTLVPGMSISASGFSTSVIKTVDSATQVTMSLIATNTGTGTVTVYNSTLTTMVTSTVANMDGRTMLVGDIWIASNQTATAQNGPWRIDSIGTGYTCSRPSWFTGTLLGPVLAQIQYGTGNTGTIISIQSSAALLTGSITIGLDPILPLIALGGRVNTAGTSSNTFTGPQTLRATTAGVSGCPIFFQAGIALMTTPQAHAVEWFNDQMYLTNAAGVRTTNTSHVAIPATATSTGQVGQIAVDNTGSWLYVCTATNVWKRVLLTTF